MWPLRDRSRPCPAAEAALPPCNALSRLGSLPSLQIQITALGTDHYWVHLALAVGGVSHVCPCCIKLGCLLAGSPLTHTQPGPSRCLYVEVNLSPSRSSSWNSVAASVSWARRAKSAPRGVLLSVLRGHSSTIHLLHAAPCIASSLVKPSPALVEGSTFDFENH